MLIISVAYIIMGKIIIKKKINYSFQGLLLFILLVMVITYFQLFYNTFIKTIPIFLLTIIIYKKIFQEGTDKSIVVAFISYSIIFLGEIIYALGGTLLLGEAFFNSENLVKNVIINNLFMAIISIIIAKLISKKLKKIIQNIVEKRNVINFILCLIIIIILTLLSYKLFINNFVIDQNFMINGTLIITAFIIGIYLFFQKLKINLVEEKYEYFVLYSKKIEEMVEKYRLLQHEHKNNLVVIREKLNKKNKDALIYINNLLEEKDLDQYSWSLELKNIPLNGLKGLLNYKINYIIEMNIDVDIKISKEIKSSVLKKLTSKEEKDLYNIIGVYIDNAIEATALSKKKEIKFEVYIENKEVCFVIINTYKGNISLNEIDNIGYSTKKEGRGYGLVLVKNILRSSKKFYQQRQLIDDYYVQKLYIK